MQPVRGRSPVGPFAETHGTVEDPAPTLGARAGKVGVRGREITC